MNAVHVLHLFLISFLIRDHQQMLLSASTFVKPGCPKCSASTTCFFNYSGMKNLSTAKTAKSFGKLAENPRKIFGSPFYSKQIFNCNSFGSTEVSWIRVFKSTMKWDSAFLRFSPASAFLGFGLSITRLT